MSVDGPSKNIHINLKDGIFIGELAEEASGFGFPSAGMLFRIKKESSSEPFGCLLLLVSATTVQVWRNQWKGDLNQQDVNNVFSCILPSIKIDASSNDLERLYLGENFKCYKVNIDTNEPEFYSDNNGTHIKGFSTPEDLVRKVVYSDIVSDSKVENEILKVLYDYYIFESHDTKILFDVICNKIFRPKKEVDRCLKHLKAAGYVDLQLSPSDNLIVVSAGISAGGVNFVRSGFGSSGGGDKVVHNEVIYGDKINASTYGDGSPNIVKSNYNLTEILSELRSEVENNSQADNKEALISEIDEIQKLAQNTENKQTIIRSLGGLLAKVKDVAIERIITKALDFLVK